MEKKSRKFKTPPGFVAADVEVDIITCLDRNERVFQARMLEIFRKYDRPFVNNIVVNIQDFTYMTAEGRRPWTFEANIFEDGGSEEFSKEVVSETENIGVATPLVLPKKMPSVRKSQGLSPRKWTSCDLPVVVNSPCSKKKSSTTFEVEPFYGQTTALMEHNEHKEMSPRNSGLGVMRKNMPVALPVNITIYEQMKRFMERNNKECFSESSGKYAVCQEDGSGSSDREEASYSEPGNKTLGDYYPQMIENLCSLLDFQVKNQIADNIVRHYKRLILRKKILEMKMVNRSMSRSFNRTYTLCPVPSSEEIATAPKTYVSTQLQEPRLSLFSKLCKYDRPAAAVPPHVDFQNNASKPFQCILDSQTIHKDSPFQSQQEKEMNGAMSLGYSSGTSPSFKMCISPSKSITNKSHIDIAIAQSPYCKDSKDLLSLSRKNVISGISMLHSPKQMIAKPNCNMSEESKSPRNSMTTDSQREVDRNVASFYKDHVKQPPERTSTLTRRNSISAFSGGHSKNGDFESLFRNLTKNGPQPVNSAQIELSKTAYSSLGNSPGSLRAKRLLSHESLVSTSKKPRRVISSLNSSFSMDCSDSFGLELSSSRAQQHSAAASPLPPYMSPNSSGSHRSSSPRFNGRSPKRTSACVHRKLIYQED
ncbi:uncharacterized protein LOC120995602 isoform X2 [Bufo bufo]|uniref:uncharacterized protein LOC120995602 isoform X2 n=1 Tax=Bufo bufo TaxID=8384 RepID=UPI001ABE7AD8|nr:uncharacterized protein LOC120995602 isoform X2 [Bufo bufo]